MVAHRPHGWHRAFGSHGTFGCVATISLCATIGRCATIIVNTWVCLISISSGGGVITKLVSGTIGQYVAKPSAIRL